MPDRKQTGDAGEELAARHLETLGYVIIERNVRCRRGEIDIVARQGGDLVLVEVRTRRGARFGTAAESVRQRKAEAMAHSAQEYLQRRRLTNASVRCDLVAIDLAGEQPRLEVIRDAVPLGDLL